MVVAFDTLKAARRLQDEAGFDEKQAAVLVSTFAEGLTENLATKADLARGLTAVRGEMRTTWTVHGPLSHEVQAFPGAGGAADLDTRLLHARTESVFSELRADLRAFEQRLYLFMGLMMITFVAVITAVITIATAILLVNLT